MIYYVIKCILYIYSKVIYIIYLYIEDKNKKYILSSIIHHLICHISYIYYFLFLSKLYLLYYMIYFKCKNLDVMFFQLMLHIYLLVIFYLFFLLNQMLLIIMFQLILLLAYYYQIYLLLILFLIVLFGFLLAHVMILLVILVKLKNHVNFHYFFILFLID